MLTIAVSVVPADSGATPLNTFSTTVETVMISQQPAIDQLGKISAFNEFDHPVKFATLWKKQNGVLVFVRHFG